MRIGAAIYQHTDGRWEARYRKGRKPDGTVIYGSVYGKTYEEAERKRAELLQGLALQAANGESEEAAAISEINRSVRDFYAVVPKGKNAFPEPLTDERVEALIPYIHECYPGLRLSICLALYMGLASDVLATLKWSDIDPDAGTLLISRVMVDAKHMFGTVSPCEKRVLLIPKIIYDFIDLPTAVRREGDHYILTRNGERIKSLRSERLLWLKALSVYGYTGSITPEILRATFIRNCFEKGINFETVSYFTGLTVLVLRTKYGHFAKANLDIPNSIYETPTTVVATGKQMNLLILGSGSHGHAVYEIADRLGIFRKISFLDDNITGDGIVGRIEDVLEYRGEYPLCFVAIGNNERRKELAEKVTKAGFIMPRLISPETSVARGAVIGQGTIVMPQATINAGAKIGDFCIIASNSLIGFNATVESYAHCDCASVVMKDCTVSTLMTVESGEIVKQSIH